VNSNTILGGTGSTDALTMNADPTTSGLAADFVLKEVPNPGGSPPPFVPLPTGALSGLSALIGLGLIGAVKKMRRRIA
jgi:hypothetical protein